MTKEQEERVLQEAGELFERIRTDSLRTGAKMIASVILGMALEEKSEKQRIQDIIHFCELTIGKNEKN